MNILISNDDGIQAEGIRRLAEALSVKGDVYVVAPDSQRSASSHALGTSKAREMGEIQGAMSSIAIGVCGLISVIISLFI